MLYIYIPPSFRRQASMMVIDSRSMLFDEANKNLKHHFVQAESTWTPRAFVIWLDTTFDNHQKIFSFCWFFKVIKPPDGGYLYPSRFTLQRCRFQGWMRWILAGISGRACFHSWLKLGSMRYRDWWCKGGERIFGLGLHDFNTKHHSKVLLMFGNWHD